MKFKTRPATPGDREQLFKLYASVLKVHIAKIWGWDESWQQNDFNTHFVPEQIQVATVDGQVVAYVHTISKNGIPHVRMMCVRTEFQRKGIGDTLLRSFIQRCSAAQKNVTLRVFRINPDARRFYEKLGFEVCGTTETHYEMTREI